MVKVRKPLCVIYQRSDSEKKMRRAASELEVTKEELNNTKSQLNDLSEEVKELRKLIALSGKSSKSSKK